ncbi:hypothetical protein HOLleu_05010 [Holothuria leucospilota]|uniref:Uncharacterized protein n=1 Tax=Holothuria leucospilota TaxID=206669 RepID=A0A9Q1HE91_HOLLE|nr:hypothetical protein HOLleu_05010 [Holothuria leucospilota]
MMECYHENHLSRTRNLFTGYECQPILNECQPIHLQHRDRQPAKAEVQMLAGHTVLDIQKKRSTYLHISVVAGGSPSMKLYDCIKRQSSEVLPLDIS